ncbi:hypothetical protein BJX63DRAFT_89519 [Aspergillus granulosus]|uniref:Uncharacterized protein n=1 Tax=Aspergillus granulosus TaxID=176169 RepID=A0ABR4GWV9_9EURO
MCTFYIVKYLCDCIYDEWILPCFFSRGPSILLRRPNTQSDSLPRSNPLPKQNSQPCYHTRIIETYDVLTLCEVCFSQLDSQIRTYGVTPVLASPERFPLAEKLGMLVVVENDALEQWRLFRKGVQRFLLQREVGAESLRGMGGRVSVPVVGPRRVKGPDADAVWKVESSRIYRLDYTIYEGRQGESENVSDGFVASRTRRSKREGVWQGTYYEERALGHWPGPEDGLDVQGSEILL